jgi:hypothetical protein
MKRKGQKERLKPISLYGHKLEDVIRAFMQVDPKRIKELEEEERRLYERDRNETSNEARK